MYDHIEKVQEYIKPLKIEIIKINFDYWMQEHIKTRGKNKNKKGYGWPDFRNRWCTSLKRDTINRFIIDKNDLIEYHGISFDEQHRTEKNEKRDIKYPLVDWGMRGKDCIQYCYNRGFDWGGLYEKRKRVSCYCCPLADLVSLKQTYLEFPELWAKIVEMDKKSYRMFKFPYTVEQLEKKFIREDRRKYHKLW